MNNIGSKIDIQRLSGDLGIARPILLNLSVL